MDPLIQYSALQLRWLLPLLELHPASHSFLISILAHCLRLFLQSLLVVVPLLFPLWRPRWSQPLGSFWTLFKCMDDLLQLGLSVNWNAFNVSMIQKVPLTVVCPSLSTHSRRRWNGVLVCDAYQYETFTGDLRRITFDGTRRRHHNKLLEFFSLASTGEFPFTESFLRFSEPAPLEHPTVLLVYRPRLPTMDFSDVCHPLLANNVSVSDLTPKACRLLFLPHPRLLPDWYLWAPQAAWRRF